MTKLRRLTRNRATHSLRRHKRLAVLLLVVATLPWVVPPVWAASNTASEAVCDVSADYALGIEDYPEAIRLHEKVLRLDPNDALAHYHLGFAFGMNHDAPAELREYLRAEELGLRQWDLFLNLGLLYMERHELRAAINALTIATRLGPQYGETHFNLSLAYERTGLLPQALREILASLELEPDQPDTQNTLAIVYAEMGNYEGARAIWAKLVQIDPDYQPARKNLAIVERMTTGGAPPVRPSWLTASSGSSR
jgi:tetratricopeptide (TPR) repeat protein